MWSVCWIAQNNHSGSIASGIPSILLFPNRRRCRIGEYRAMYPPGSLVRQPGYQARRAVNSVADFQVCSVLSGPRAFGCRV